MAEQKLIGKLPPLYVRSEMGWCENFKPLSVTSCVLSLRVCLTCLVKNPRRCEGLKLYAVMWKAEDVCVERSDQHFLSLQG